MRGPLSTCRHTTPSKNSSTQKAIQSPPQLQFPDLQPFLRKAGYKCAAPDSLPLPVLLHPHQPFPLPSAFKPLGISSFSTTNTTPKLLGTHTEQMLLDRVVQYWKSLHPSAHSLNSSHISVGKQSNNPISRRSFYKKHLFCSKSKASVSAENMRS